MAKRVLLNLISRQELLAPASWAYRILVRSVIALSSLELTLRAPSTQRPKLLSCWLLPR